MFGLRMTAHKSHDWQRGNKFTTSNYLVEVQEGIVDMDVDVDCGFVVCDM